MAQNLTEVRLLSVPLENDYLHTIYFETIGEQESYFKSKTQHIFTDCSYQRKDNMFRASKHIDDIVNCNYVMYRNRPYTDKWCYAFITKMEYKDDGRTDVYIETDVMQTWLQDYVVKASFVEREHCRVDTPGLHTVPEQLETGDYICNESVQNTDLLESCIILATTVNLGTLNKNDPDNNGGSMYNGIYSGVWYYCFYYKDTDFVSGKIFTLQRTLEYLAKKSKSDSVVALFLAPKKLLNVSDVTSITVYDGDLPLELRSVNATTTAFEEYWSGTGSGVGTANDTPITKPLNINGYTPKNKKLFTDPYCYLLVDNNAGGCAKYKYEYFDTAQCTFKVEYAVTPGGSTKLYPLFYEGLDVNVKEGLTGGKYPICCWNTDVYTNWLTQNSVNLGISTITNIAQTAIGAGAFFTGSGALAGGSMVSSGVMGIANTMGEVYQRSLQPAQLEGNLNSGDVIFAGGKLTFNAYKMTIKKEFAQSIDEYFSMFGYKTNRVKVPYYNHRKNWWYTKTIDVNIDLSSNSKGIPQGDLLKIKECYNKGITFWKKDNIGDYSLDNPITWVEPIDEE